MKFGGNFMHTYYFATTTNEIKYLSIYVYENCSFNLLTVQKRLRFSCKTLEDTFENLILKSRAPIYLALIQFLEYAVLFSSM